MPWQNEADPREEHHQSNLDLVRNRHGDLAGFDKLELYAQGVANRSQASHLELFASISRTADARTRQIAPNEVLKADDTS
jgi:hypothetical protein